MNPADPFAPAPARSRSSAVTSFAFGLSFLVFGVLGFGISFSTQGRDSGVFLTFGVLAVVSSITLLGTAAVLRRKG